jgi:hypothetical protein
MTVGVPDFNPATFVCARRNDPLRVAARYCLAGKNEALFMPNGPDQDHPFDLQRGKTQDPASPRRQKENFNAPTGSKANRKGDRG